MPRYKISVEYNGGPFVGWQRQDTGPSIQACLEDAIFAFSGERLKVRAAGRTDSGDSGYPPADPGGGPPAGASDIAFSRGRGPSGGSADIRGSRSQAGGVAAGERPEPSSGGGDESGASGEKSGMRPPSAGDASAASAPCGDACAAALPSAEAAEAV